MGFKSFKENYANLQEKYSLPPLDDMNREFELLDILKEKDVNPSFPLRFTRRMMISIFYSWINYLHNLIMPNPQSFIHVKESEAFNDDEKTQVHNIIKEIMFINRLSAKLDLEHDQQKDAEFIKKYYKEWRKIKSLILELAEKNISCWKEEMPKDKEIYFG